MFMSLKNNTMSASTGADTVYNSEAFVLAHVLVGVMTYGFLSSICADTCFSCVMTYGFLDFCLYFYHVSFW